MRSASSSCRRTANEQICVDKACFILGRQWTKRPQFHQQPVNIHFLIVWKQQQQWQQIIWKQSFKYIPIVMWSQFASGPVLFLLVDWLPFSWTQREMKIFSASVPWRRTCHPTCEAASLIYAWVDRYCVTDPPPGLCSPGMVGFLTPFASCWAPADSLF